MGETGTQSEQAAREDPFPARPFITEHQHAAGGATIRYTAIADWITLRKKHRPVARIFHVAYLRKGVRDAASRPLTFVFNGGPGAASAYLHMGTVGPRRVAFGKRGEIPPSPARVVDNEETWLAFTDLVFIDPVGTGFSRPLDPPAREDKTPDAKDKKPDDKENPEFWEVTRDLESLGEFIQAFLSRHRRWTSPTFLAGESYGGFRVARMARRLQETHGVGLTGAILISPAIEFGTLFGTDYDLTRWVELLPSQAAVAHHHGKASASGRRATLEQVVTAAEAFACGDLLTWLARGDGMGRDAVRKLAERMSALIGLPPELIAAAGGRIDTERFSRLLLRPDRKLIGRYDGSVTTADPFPDRESYDGPDPTLAAIERLFTTAINQHLRETLGVETELDYRLLSMEVNEAWRFAKDTKGIAPIPGAMDDLRYGMSLNEHMRVFITHGYFDLVTPYFASNRLSGLMKLTADQRSRLTLQHYRGGHMFYTWEESRARFRDAMRRFYRS